MLILVQLYAVSNADLWACYKIIKMKPYPSSQCSKRGKLSHGKCHLSYHTKDGSTGLKLVLKKVSLLKTFLNSPLWWYLVTKNIKSSLRLHLEINFFSMIAHSTELSCQLLFNTTWHFCELSGWSCGVLNVYFMKKAEKNIFVLCM